MSTLASVILRDLFANRPAAGIEGRLFFATDTSATYRDNGTSWDTYAVSTGIANPMTTAGDLIVGGTSGAATRIAVGASGDVLTSNGAGVAWQAGGAGGAAFDILSEQKASGTLFSVKNEYASLTSGTPVTLLSKAGDGYISSIFFAFTGTTNYSSSLLQVWVNGESTPSISCTLRNLFVNWYNTASTVSTKFINFTAGIGEGFNLCIPYSNGIIITLTPTANETSFWSMITGQSGVTDDWPYTRKLRMNNIDAANPATTNGLAFAPYSYETIANFVSGSKGRLVGLHLFDDSTSCSAANASLEGNIAIYIDAFDTVRADSTAVSLNSVIMDPGGNFQKATTAGTTGSSAPATWGTVSGTTTPDGTVTWTCSPGTPLNVWRASVSYASLGMSIVDGNGNVQTVTTVGSSGSTQPTWSTTSGGTTSDGTVTWTQSPAASMVQAGIVSSGTEDFFNVGFYGTGSGNNQQGYGGTSGVAFQTLRKITFYRYFMNDPIRFNNSIGIIRQIGDSSQVAFTGNALEGALAMWYTEETT